MKFKAVQTVVIGGGVCLLVCLGGWVGEWAGGGVFFSFLSLTKSPKTKKLPKMLLAPIITRPTAPKGTSNDIQID